MTTTSLYTAQYELTMAQAALPSGAEDVRTPFEVFAPTLPTGRRYGVFAGLGRLLDALARFRFAPAALAILDGVPTAGTAAHAFTLVHHSELDAFKAQVAALGAGTTLLVDTLDVGEGIRHAAAAGGAELGAIRIDSGDLAAEATRARQLLDSLG